MSFSTIYSSLSSDNSLSREMVNQSQSLVSYGRNFTPIYHTLENQLRTGSISFSDKMMMEIGKILNKEATLIQQLLPTSIKQIFSQAEKILCQGKSKEQSIILYQQVDKIRQQIIEERKQLCFLAGVSSMDELEKKRQQIAEYKKEAGKLYLQNQQNIETRRQLDKALTALKRTENQQENEEIIDKYWNLIAQDPNGYEEMQQTEGRSLVIFTDSMMSTIASLPERLQKQMNEGKEVNPIEMMIKLLNDSMNTTAEKLLQEKESLDINGQIKIDYLLLKGSIIMPALLNKVVKQQVNQQIEKSEEMLQPCLETVRKWHKERLEEYSERIKADQVKLEMYEKENQEALSVFKGKETSYKGLREVFQEDIRNFEAILAEENQKTEEDLYTEAYEILGDFTSIDPRLMRQYLPLETEGDKKIQQFLELDLGLDNSFKQQNSLILPNASSDLQVDLTQLKDPTEYFLQQMKLDDAKKLNILSD
jgi:hypothetical protein